MWGRGEPRLHDRLRIDWPTFAGDQGLAYGPGLPAAIRVVPANSIAESRSVGGVVPEEAELEHGTRMRSRSGAKARSRAQGTKSPCATNLIQLAHDGRLQRDAALELRGLPRGSRRS